MVIYEFLMLHSTEQVDAQSSVYEKQQEHQPYEVRNLRNYVEQCIQNQFDILTLSDQSDNTHYSEGSNHCGCC